MGWNEIQRIFDRAALQTLDLRKLLFAFAVLATGGLLILFFRAIAMHTGTLIALSLAFMPFFLCAALLLAAGIILVRAYHDAVKKKRVSYREIFARSWPLMMGASYFSIPIILGYLVLWMLLGLFNLLKDIPYIGDFFAVVLVFGPFLLNVGSLLLCVLNIAMLFFLTPIVALRGINRLHVTQMLSRRFRMDIFTHLFLFVIALTPVLLTLGLLHLSLCLTGIAGFVSKGAIQSQVQWLFIMIPYTALLAPATVFFFNFATEAHVLMQSQLRRPLPTER